MGRDEEKTGGWFPLRGSWEEAVLSWNEQIESSFRRRELGSVRGPVRSVARTEVERVHIAQ